VGKGGAGTPKSKHGGAVSGLFFLFGHEDQTRGCRGCAACWIVRVSDRIMSGTPTKKDGVLVLVSEQEGVSTTRSDGRWQDYIVLCGILVVVAMLCRSVDRLACVRPSHADFCRRPRDRGRAEYRSPPNKTEQGSGCARGIWM
jgi:hypothetical protein